MQPKLFTRSAKLSLKLSDLPFQLRILVMKLQVSFLKVGILLLINEHIGILYGTRHFVLILKLAPTNL